MALSNIYLLQYNNYFNRKVKRLTTAAEYIAKAIHVTPNASFNPGDGVTAQHVINNGIACDYCVVTNQSDTEIESRWFVIESARTRNGQYQYTLKRDVIADYYNMIIDSPCYIEKATLQPNDPFIFNPEGNGFNQIKTSETLLKDHYGVPWIIGYYNLGDGQNGNPPATVEGTVKFAIKESEIYATYTDFNDFASRVGNINTTYYDHINSYSVTTKMSDTINVLYTIDTAISNDSCDTVSINTANYSQNKYKLVYKNGLSVTSAAIKSVFTDAACADLTAKLDTLTYKPAISNFKDLLGKYIKIGNTAYKIQVSKRIYKANSIITQNAGAAFLKLKDLYTTVYGAEWNDSNPNNPFSYKAEIQSYDFSLLSYTGLDYTLSLNNTKTALKDQPWKMFAIPYGGTFKQGESVYTIDKEAMLNLATDLAKTTSAVYDVQIVPYTINNGFWDAAEAPNFKFPSWAVAGTDYDIVKSADDDTNTPRGFVWYPDVSSFCNTIKLANPVIVTEPKIQNECDMYRLVGPNYSGGFEFSAAKNGGISQFEVNCTYLPVSPYIHINPTFGGLYGQDFDDARGLICQGNFSISTVSDAWKNYVIQNKNFNEMFNRELENMEVSRSIQKKQELANVIVGTLGGAVSGGTGGALVGGGIGAAIGGVAGGTASLAGGLADMKFSQQLYDESKSFKKDMRDYSLGNIRALPQTLSKTSAYNIDNKYFPFLEYYTCTDKEKQALRDQIKYTGMTVMRTGKISEFLQEDYSYVQGKLIWLEEINDDTHLCMAIADEIMRGVYIK